jgi:tetratricopeptide (TPR) repeat protein
MPHLTKYLLAVLLTSSPAFAQANPHDQIQSAFTFEQQGDFAQVINTIQPLLASNQLSGTELGKVLIMFGVAYEGQGSFTEAQHAYDRALALLDHDDQHLSEYAAALQNYARLESELSQLDAAESMWQKALQLREQTGERAAVARSLLDLAGLSLARNKVAQAHEYVKRADDAMKHARDASPDDFAIAFETRGWLASSEHRPSDAVANYQRALDLTEHAHGRRHWLSGWERMLLGKAYGEVGDQQQALANMQQGLKILQQSLGPTNPKYFTSQIAYAQLLDKSGAHEEAARLKASAEQASKDFYGTQCLGCTINKAAFR